MDERRPKTIKVCVYSARNLKPKKGDGDPLAWVVFGFGKEKCCTGQLRDRNAKWNEESTFTVMDAKSSLKFNVKDKDDPLGQIIIPLDEIPSEEHFLKWVPLGPHKKNNNPHGELCIDCWVEDYYHGDEQSSPPTSTRMTTGKFLKKNFSKLTGNKSPDFNRKRNGLDVDRRHSYAAGETSIKGSVSMEDLSSRNGKSSSLFGNKNKKEKDSLLAPPAYTNMRKSVSTLVLNTSSTNKEPSSPPGVVVNPAPTSPTPIPGPRRHSNPVNELISSSATQGLPTIKEQCYPPRIQTIIPTSGPSTGGTLIQITGKYLGNSREDITRLMVAGCNCLDTVEYYTANKIICTTKESIGIGPITLSTRSGGMSSSKMMFEFVEVKDSANHEKGSTDSGRSSGASDSEKGQDKDEIIERLRNEVDDLKHDNQELREYIDKLVVYLMDKYPSALESSKMYR